MQVYVHCVFFTKERRPWLQIDEERRQVHAYLAGICEGQSSPAINIGGTADHVHILCRLGKVIDVSTLIRELKRESTKWVKKEFAALKGFSWQQGYGAFSLSPAHVNAVKSYVSRQMEHHRTETFQEEFRRICAKYRVELDERYAWD
ncbi:MAG: transposase [Pirellula sp.]|nr:transposase [Pirellula sp.]